MSEQHIECDVKRNNLSGQYMFYLNQEQREALKLPQEGVREGLSFFLSEAVNIPGYLYVIKEDNAIWEAGSFAPPYKVRFRVPVEKKKEIYTCAECGRAIGREGFVLNTLTGECICNECDPPHQPPKCEDCAFRFNTPIKTYCLGNIEHWRWDARHAHIHTIEYERSGTGRSKCGPDGKCFVAREGRGGAIYSMGDE